MTGPMPAELMFYLLLLFSSWTGLVHASRGVHEVMWL